MKKKNIAQVTIIIATFLLAIPLTPSVRAITKGSLSISPAVNYFENGDVFQTQVAFSVPATNPIQVTGYDVKITYNPDILQVIVTGNEFSFSLFDLNQNGIITDDPVLVAHADVFNSIGFARFTAVTLGGASAQPGLTPGRPLVTLTFAALFAPTATATELPASIGLSGIVVGLDNQGNTIKIPIDVSSGTYEPNPGVALTSPGCKATIQGWNIHSHGPMAGVYCNAFNPSSNPSTIQANFAFQGLKLPAGVVSGSPTTLAPGQAAILTALIDVTAAAPSDIVLVTGSVARAYVMPDGTTAMLSGGSSTFKLVVRS